MNESIIRRKVVLDVERTNGDSRSRNNKRRRRRERALRNNVQIDPGESDVKPVPLELRPVIDSMIDYGRRTNALGKLAVTDILAGFVRDVRKIQDCHGDVPDGDNYEAIDRELTSLIQRMEHTMHSIKKEFEAAYESSGATEAT